MTNIEKAHRHAELLGKKLRESAARTTDGLHDRLFWAWTPGERASLAEQAGMLEGMMVAAGTYSYAEPSREMPDGQRRPDL